MKNNYLKISLLMLIVLIFSIQQGCSATFTVDNTADTDNGAAYTAGDGTNTLRKCIRLANANANTPTVDNITFAAALTGGITITLTASLPLPFITDPLLIDGFTANGYVAPTPRVSILAKSNPNAFNVASGGNNSIIRGFAVSNTSADGIYINGATGVTITGCWIGLLATGALPGGSSSNKVNGHGITVTGNSNNCIIGIATAAGQNVISGCLGHGILITSSTGVIVKNNYIGTNTTGVSAITNSLNGININTNSTSCIIGGSASNEGNLISGNTNSGLEITSASSNIVIKGNKIGTNLGGTGAIANGVHGINIYTNVLNTVIGGAAANEGNLISGNTLFGINIDAASNNPVIKGNFIGVNATGISAIANVSHGIQINATTGAVIGGGLSGEGNVISGNGGCGVNILSTSTSPTIKGNLIGLNAAGTSAIGNSIHGINIDASNGAIIGGNTKGQRNIVSGNGKAASQNGISISNSNNHFIKGNFVGTDITGLVKWPNYDTGLSISNSTGDSIGGQTYMERNVLSGNGNTALTTSGHGLYLGNTVSSRFYGNFIGTDSTGKAVLGNHLHGVYTCLASNLNYWYNNVVSGNTKEGFDINGCSTNYFYGNFIGLGVDGVTKVANSSNGMRIGIGTDGTTVSANHVIGGVLAGQRNYISGNGNGTVVVSGCHGFDIENGSNNIIFKGNYIGCDITGMVAIGNTGAGIMFINGANNNTVGGTGAGEGNLLCCSTGDWGLRFNVANSNVVYGNLIGVNAALSLAAGFGNFQFGVGMVSYTGSGYPSTSNSNVIGRIGAGSNIIANNGSDGVNVNNAGGTSSDYNPIIGNKIYCNGGLGINMQNNSATENEGVPAPVVTSSTANAISGTGTTGDSIHVYRNQYNDGSGRCDCEGEIYVGKTIVAGGTWSLTHNLGLTAAQASSVTATQTNSTHSTSKFWVCSVPLPVDMLSLQAVRNNNVVDVNFSVASESNINSYNILRSKDGINFEMIGSEMPMNNVNGITSYSFEDANPLVGTSYYRIQTVENDGRVAHSKIVSTTNQQASVVTLFPNPATDEVTILSSNAITRIEMQNTLGQIVFEKNTTVNELTIPLINLATGVYFVKIYEGETAKIYKLEKR